MTAQGARTLGTALALPRAAMMIGAGIISAAHVGKAVIALPHLADELGLDLPQSGAILGSFMILGVFFGSLMGRLVDRLGGVRSILFGLAGTGVASLLAPLVPTAVGIGGLRAIEGLSFLVVATAVPGVLARGLLGPRRQFVLGFWGLYMPAGQASAVLLGPLFIQRGGWQSLWVALGVASLLSLLLVWWAGRAVTEHPAGRQQPPDPPSPAPRRLLGWLLAAMFGFYSLQYAAVSGFLPVSLNQLHAVSSADAGWLTALVMMSNAVGNIVGGMLQHRAFPGSRSLVIGTTGMLVAALLVFLVPAPLPLTMALFVLFALFGGLVPSTILSLVPRAAAPHGLGRLNGLVNQAVQIGSLIGPPLVGLGVATSEGWPGALWILVPANMTAILVAVGIGRSLEFRAAGQPAGRPATA